MIAGLWNTPRTQEELNYFSFVNADLHNRITLAIKAQHNVALPTLLLDPISPIAHEDWAYRHQSVHNSQNQVLGITGNDLTEINFKDESQLQSWISLHAEEMIQACLKLGIA